MAASREKESLAKVLAHEGGYSNNKADPGGPTMKGVTQHVYDGYRRGKGLSTRSVKNITTAELNDIYDKQYWDAVKGDLLPDGVDYVVFDGGVNSGPGRSIMWLQQALRPAYTGPIDGVVGVGTLAALKAVNNNDALIDCICDARMNFLRHLGTFRLSAKAGRRVSPKCARSARHGRPARSRRPPTSSPAVRQRPWSRMPRQRHRPRRPTWQPVVASPAAGSLAR
ncbi:glycoside hydrolase family 108 protein [Mesorhizobium sp. B2-4-9]|uniref:glycoside hydrolase family 108 protein n=1 Tax=Mesorhizobium sp. B2-4-9 TaxID=2589940 RepID=UPI001FED504B|nr:glycoside hydrolase family 108 protein [Mesorhizobium sp. B2-4-9]